MNVNARKKQKAQTGKTGSRLSQKTVLTHTVAESLPELTMEPQVRVLGAEPKVNYGVLTRGRYFLGHWLMLLLVPIVACTAAAVLTSFLKPPLYAARTYIVIHLQQPGDAVVRYLASQAIIIGGPSVIDPVADTTGISAEKLAQGLSVDFPKGGDVMQIQYVNTDRDIALDVTKKILSQYERVIGLIEENESAGHQVLSPPAIVRQAVNLSLSQLAAIGAAIGLMIGLVGLTLNKQLRSIL
jgi:capsular polysaccharide biosynthesis protein